MDLGDAGIHVDEETFRACRHMLFIKIPLQDP